MPTIKTRFRKLTTWKPSASMTPWEWRGRGVTALTDRVRGREKKTEPPREEEETDTTSKSQETGRANKRRKRSLASLMIRTAQLQLKEMSHGCLRGEWDSGPRLQSVVVRTAFCSQWAHAKVT